MVFAVGVCGSVSASAALFEDGEARKAILDLRQKFESQKLAVEQAKQACTTHGASQADSLLALQRQIELLRGELAQLRGEQEKLAAALAEEQRQRKDETRSVADRLGKLEPAKVNVDGAEFVADPAERREYDAAMQAFKQGDYLGAQQQFVAFIERYPGSGYLLSAFFWLGNAQYATRDYKEAIFNFRAMVSRAPKHIRSPEAILAVASCQLELKDVRAARKTLQELIQTYPKSEAAVAARERLAALNK
ncbi:hypothetical protein Cenrod_0428 [Candidatus Symbiobacter mobilis CR]|uniref:Cell division coordinator CpoB n=2 Tax=Candidatus Symbiobacter TaxID=1436289 RepID=U5N5B9_9BURK|nr:hypothetical protein Cenrod_0428 [Candidatus Symbiobacter mobilis CR]